MLRKTKENSDVIQFNSFIKRIADKDTTALKALYEKYGRLIYSAAFTVLKNAQLADETVDDVLLKIWKSAQQLGFIKYVRGWLYKITVNQAKDKLKSERSVFELFDLAASQSDENEEESEIDFYSYISDLDELEQQILILKFVEDLSFKQISKELKKPLSTITSSYYRALEKIKNNKFE